MVTCPGLYRFPGNALKIISYVSDRQGIPLLCQDSLLSGRTGLLGMARGKILALMQAAGQAHNTNRGVSSSKEVKAKLGKKAC
jgi:hypothetical protein